MSFWSSQADVALKNLSLTLTDVSHLYVTPDNQQPYFLSQIGLDGYHDAEQAFTEQLTAYARKQFFEVISIFNLLVYIFLYIKI